MGDRSKIEWTDATWNPATGCTKVSEGCRNCYAERVAVRLKEMGKAKYANGFAYTEHTDGIDQPLRWKRPRMIFVNSMSDLFHEHATEPFLNRCFDIMDAADWHTYQILTKRPLRMAEYSERYVRRRDSDIPPYIWMGTSVENASAARRIDELRRVRCAVRFVSFEPLLGPVPDADLTGIHWCIIGGESGPGHRPVREEWILDLIGQCRRQGVPVLFKQWGGARPDSGGRTIRGRTYDEFPEVRRERQATLA